MISPGREKGATIAADVASSRPHPIPVCVTSVIRVPSISLRLPKMAGESQSFGLERGYGWQAVFSDSTPGSVYHPPQDILETRVPGIEKSELQNLIYPNQIAYSEGHGCYDKKKNADYCRQDGHPVISSPLGDQGGYFCLLDSAGDGDFF